MGLLSQFAGSGHGNRTGHRRRTSSAGNVHVAECYRWSEKALLVLDEARRGTCDEMRLQAALGYSLMFTRGGGDEARAALDRSLSIAGDRGELTYQMWLLSALNIFHFRGGNRELTLQCAKRSLAVDEALGD